MSRGEASATHPGDIAGRHSASRRGGCGFLGWLVRKPDEKFFNSGRPTCIPGILPQVGDF